MNFDRQLEFDKRIKRHHTNFLKNIINNTMGLEEATYCNCLMAQDHMRMFMLTVLRQLHQQEARAAIKVAFDTVLVEFGLSIAIPEFDKSYGGTTSEN